MRKQSYVTTDPILRAGSLKQTLRDHRRTSLKAPETAQVPTVPPVTSLESPNGIPVRKQSYVTADPILRAGPRKQSLRDHRRTSLKAPETAQVPTVPLVIIPGITQRTTSAETVLRDHRRASLETPETAQVTTDRSWSGSRKQSCVATDG